MRTKTAAWVAAGVIGAGASAGISYAAVATPAAADSTTPIATQPAQPSTQSPGNGAPHLRMRGAHAGGLVARVEHGQLTLRVKGADRTVDIQRGTVDSVSATSISVTSEDGFAATYAVTSTTRIRGASGRESISSVHKGDKVLVVATAGNALRIADRAGAAGG